VTKRILELEGAQVRLAGNGLEAFELLQAEPLAIDVVLMDVQMPVLNGHDATKRIRVELGLTDLPIIALTAGALSSERQRAATAGMDGYITKPFDAQSLVSSVLRQITPVDSQPVRGNDVAPESPTLAAVPWPEIEGIDSAEVWERLAGDLILFRSSLKRLLDEFSDVAIPPTTDDAAVFAVHAGRMHKLRGSAGMLGARAIQQLAGEAEVACAAGDVERASSLATSLGAQLRRLQLAAAPALRSVQAAVEDEVLPVGDELKPHDLADLINLLREQSLAAVDRFGSISPQLRRLLSKDSYELVRDHIGNLQFSDAASTLEANQR
jgi:CheY-like chemotaxis protein